MSLCRSVKDKGIDVRLAQPFRDSLQDIRVRSRCVVQAGSVNKDNPPPAATLDNERLEASSTGGKGVPDCGPQRMADRIEKQIYELVKRCSVRCVPYIRIMLV